MLRFLADEDFDQDIVRGLMRRLAEIDIVTAQESGLSGVEDSGVLARAAEEGRILLTHDARTMMRFAGARIEAGLPMPGVFVVRQATAPGVAIDTLELLAECSLEREWDWQIRFVP